jgi:hypothetical protein
MSAVPAEKVALIDREAGLLGTLLSDKYDQFFTKKAQEKKVIDTLTASHPSIKPALEQALKTFGKTRPSPEQVSKILDAYKMERMVKVSPRSPLHNLSFSEWWSAWTTPEKEAETALVPHVGWMNKMMASVGSFLTPVAASPSTLVQQKREGGVKQLEAWLPSRNSQNLRHSCKRTWPPSCRVCVSKFPCCTASC